MIRIRQGGLHGGQRVVRNPSLSHEHLSCDVDRAHAHRVINSLLAQNYLNPIFQTVAHFTQNIVAMLRGRVERRLQLDETRRALGVHLSLTCVILRERIPIHVERLTDFDDFLSRSLTREKHHAHGLFALFARRGIDDGAQDLRLLQKHVPSRRAKQNPLERDHLIREDNSSDESESHRRRARGAVGRRGRAVAASPARARGVQFRHL